MKLLKKISYNNLDRFVCCVAALFLLAIDAGLAYFMYRLFDSEAVGLFFLLYAIYINGYKMMRERGQELPWGSPETNPMMEAKPRDWRSNWWDGEEREWQ